MSNLPTHPPAAGAGATVVPLRERLFNRAVEEAWPEYERALEEREIRQDLADLPPRLRLVR